MRLDLFEYETTVDDGGGAEPAEPAEPVEPSEPEPAEPEGGEPEAWAGPTREEWEQTRAQLAEANDFVRMVTDAQQQPEVGYEPDELPEFDPLDPEAAHRYFEARDQRLLQQLQGMLSPVLEKENDARAEQWVEQTFAALQVPEDETYREMVLYGSAGFQQFDAQGRALVHPQQAARASFEMTRRFEEHIRADERAKVKQEQDQSAAALRERASAPEFPSGPAGAEGEHDEGDELSAARRWREREAASGAA
jgi:hypothetical protein